MTRRTFLRSKSLTAAGEIEAKKAIQNFQEIAYKNEDISESVSSIDSGLIFPSRSGPDISRDTSVVAVYAL